MAQNKPIDVVVLVPGLKGAALDKAVMHLSQAGLTGATKLDKLGIVTGAIDPDKMAALNRIEGVTFVRPQQEIHIASV